MPDLTDSTTKITPAAVALRKRIRQHLADIEYARMAADDPMPDVNDALDDVALDELAARLLADLDVERLRGIEQRARALSLRSDRLYSLFVDATGYEPNLELGDDDDQ